MPSGGKNTSNGETFNARAETATFVDAMRFGYQVAMLEMD
jgi:hypothetical protein